jgi:chitodextrinase
MRIKHHSVDIMEEMRVRKKINLSSRVRILLSLSAVSVLAIVGALLPLSLAKAAPAFVQVNYATPQTNQSSVTVNFTGAQTAGNTNVIAVGFNNATSTINSVTDSKGNTYAVAAALARGTDFSQAIYYAKNINSATAGSNTVTVTFSGAVPYADIRVAEYSGLDATSPVDVANSTSGATSGTASTGNITTTTSNELIYGAGMTDSGYSSGAPSTGYTMRVYSQPDADIAFDKNVTSTGTYSASTSATGAWLMQIVGFKAASTSGDTTAPSTPTGLSATAASSSQINLSWTASTDNVGVTGYKVFRGGTQVGTATGTTYNDTGLTPSTAYSYTVAATDAAGNTSAQSTSASATTSASSDTTAPSVPSNVTGTPSVTQVSLSWTASTDNVGVTGYKVYRGGTLVGSPTTTSYVDTGLTASTAYSYTVSAKDAAGNESAQSTAISVTTQAQPAFPFPAGMSTNHRYLVDQSGNPYLMVGDSPQSAIGNLSVSEADRYFTDRAAHGFNTVWINLLCDSYTGCSANGATADGIKPFTTGTTPTDYDLSTPNETYFARADAIINSAASHGLTVLLDPIETGGWLDTMVNNGATKDTNFGKYLGNRYKTSPNILWMSGNDYLSWSNPAYDTVVRAVATGIQTNDPNHVQTLELDYPTSSSLNDTNWSSMLGLNASYTYAPTYAEVLHGYNQTPTMPDFMVEANYEFEHNPSTDGGSTPNLRRQEYWTMTSGATGQLYGSGNTWKIANGWAATDLDTIGVTQLGYLTSLLQGSQWYNLVPDQTHTLLTAGYGTFASTGSIETNDYVSASKTPDGSLAMAYIPSSRTVTVDMSKMGSQITAKWYDVTAGTYATISGSPFANTGTHQFTTPGTHSDATSDWVLVLTAAGGGSDTTAPSTPTNLSATAVSQSQINLSWTASTDNVGVTGYKIFRGGTQVGTSSTTSYNDTGLTASTAYTYTVKATDAAGNDSAASTSASATTQAAPDTTAPSTPTNLTVGTVTSSTVNLSWTASTDNVGVTGYKVYRGGTLVGSPTGTSYQDTGLTASTAYSYTVKATDAAGNLSAASSAVNATTQAAPDTTAPSTPTNLSATAVSQSQINLSWTASTDNVGVTGYKIFRGGTQVGTSSTTSYNDTGLTASTAYTYTVKATDAAGNDSAASTSASATTQAAPDTTAPSTPTNLTVGTVTSSTVNLSWTASTDNVGVTGYKVYRGGTLVGSPTGTSYQDTGLTASTAYSYTVKATDAAGNLSAASSAVNATTSSSTSYATPTFKQVNYVNPQTNQSSVTITYTSAQTAGDTNILAIGLNDITSTISSVTDSKGNVYHVAAALARGSDVSQAIYYASNIASATAGSNTVTVTFSGAVPYIDVRIAEYSGLDNTSPVDVTASASGTAALANSGNMTTTTSNELIYGAGMTDMGFNNTPVTGYTIRSLTPDTDIVVDKNVTSTGSYNAQANMSGGSWLLQAVGFRAAQL